ncbi:hypothetical protein [Streptomyces sp. NPDC002851]
MSDDKTPLDPEEIPEFTGDLGQLERDVSAVSGDGSLIWEAGSKVDSSFRGLSAYYDAPEAEQLFATTAPVASGANDFNDELGTISKALGAYASEIRPIVAKLQRLKQEAAEFRTKIAGDEDWHYDGDLIEENNNRRGEVNAAFAAFQDAERTCANKIHALFGDFRYVRDNGDDKQAKNEYGYSADMLNNAGGLPWGDKLEESVHWYEIHRHVKQFVWDGLIVDGLWGTIKGLGALVGLSDEISAGEAWKNLGKVVTGLAIIATPGAALATSQMGRDNAVGRWVDDSKKAVVEAGKAMISYDQWEQGHGARAAGGAVFNIGTAVLSGGVGAAAKGGAIARGISAASKVATAIDPMAYIARGARFGTIKISDALTNLRGIDATPHVNVNVPDAGTYHLADQPLTQADLPANSGLRPDNTLAYTHPDGHTVYLNTETNVVHRADGTPLESPQDIKAEGTAQQRGAEHVPATQQEPALSGVGGRSTDATARLGDDAIQPRGSHEAPDSGGHTAGPGWGDHGPGGNLDQHATSGGEHATTSHGGEGAAAGGDTGGVPPTGGDGLPGSGGLPEEPPKGNLPDGSWAGENGLRLDVDANASADEFMRKSAEAEPRITGAMQEIAHSVDNGKLNGLEFRLKGEDSLKRKLATDMLEDINVTPTGALGDIKDSIRYTVEVPARDYTHGVQQAVNDLQARGFENVTFKNTWDSAGYKGINSTWRDPVSGQVFEVQFHTPESFTAKMDGHALYEKERLPGVSPEELAAIKAQQKDLFGQVPVPHDAGAIHLAGHGADDVASALGKDADSVSDGLGAMGDDVGDTGGEAVRAGDDPTDGVTPGEPGSRAAGAGWVTEPSERAGRIYEEIRATPNKADLPEISRNTGVDEAVLRQVKSHLFRSQHDVPLGPGEVKRGLFEPRDDIADLWQGAHKGSLSPDEVRQFKHLLAHEYIESRLMKAGLPYAYDHPHLYSPVHDNGVFKGYQRDFPQDVRDAGAHELSPNDTAGGFKHWERRLGLKPPALELANDLSNLDDMVKAVVQELRSKGLDLK